MAGLFLGLVAASVIIAGQMIKVWNTTTVALAAVVSVVAFVGLGVQSGAVEDPSLLVFFGSGAIAICAMILPGISGSFLLLMMGMYAPVLGAITDRDLASLVAVGVGATIGLALFSSLLGWLLTHHSDRLIAAVIGLMIGSVRVLWPWPNGVGIISEEESEAVSRHGARLARVVHVVRCGPLRWQQLRFVFVIGLSTYADRRATQADPVPAAT